MQFICSKKNPLLPLTDYLTVGDPLIISVESFVGHLKIHLQASCGQNFKLMGVREQEGDGAFPIPFYGQDFNSIPAGTYFVLTHDQFGYTVFLCLSHQDLLSHLTTIDDELFLILNSGTSRDAKQTRTPLICLRGESLQQTLHDTMELAMRMTGHNGRLLIEKAPLPLWLDRLGWESGHRPNLNHTQIIEAVQSLQQQEIPVNFVMIDEGWQQVALNGKEEDRKWAMLDFEADKERFPRGLTGLVGDLHALGIRNIGVWHSVMGYRGGVHPFLAKRYDLPPDRYGRYFLGSDLGKTFQFFFDFYAYLKQVGITFVKVGDQSCVPFFAKQGMNATELHRNLQAAIQAAANIQFNQPVFNTDCLSNQNLYYWASSQIARAADPKELHHPIAAMKFIRNHLANSLWLSHLMLPDLGGWTTNGPLSEHLAIFHALSGTYNVINDLPGKHNKRLLQRIALPTGIILKADKPLTLLKSSLFVDPLQESSVYKAYTCKGKTALVAVFNLLNEKEPTTDSLSPSDIEELKGERFALFSHRLGFISLIDKNATIPITLQPHQSDIFTFVPLEKNIAIWGCFHYYLSPGPIAEVQLELESLNIKSLVGSPILLYCEREILEVRRDGEVIPWEYDIEQKTLKIDSRLLQKPGPCYYTITFES